MSQIRFLLTKSGLLKATPGNSNGPLCIVPSDLLSYRVVAEDVHKVGSLSAFGLNDFDWSFKLSTCQFRSANRALMPIHSLACRSCCTPTVPCSLEGPGVNSEVFLMFIAVYLCHHPQPTSFPQSTLHPRKSSQCRSFSTRVSPFGLGKFSLRHFVIR